MKKILVYMFVMSMMISMLAGCGGDTKEPAAENTAADTESDAEKPIKETEEEVKEEAGVSLTDGYWVLETMTMEGSEFRKEDIESIFGSLESVMVLAFSENGTVNGVSFDEILKGTYTGTIDEFEMTFADETVEGSYQDGMLKLVFADKSEMVLGNQKEMPKSIADNPWVTYDVNFTSEQTMAMSNFMSYGRYLIEDGVLYGLTHAVSANGNLGATPFTMVGDFPEFEEVQILDGDGDPAYLCKDGDYLYYIRGFKEVCRVNVNGSDPEVLFEGATEYLQIHEGRLYFTDENFHFVSTDMEGKDLKTVVDKEVYYPYFIGTDWLLFQDDADDESIHIYNTSTGTELNVTYMVTYNPVIDGKYLYCTIPSEEGEYILRVDMSNPETFYSDASDKYLLPGSNIMIDDVTIYTANDNSRPKEEWKELEVTDAYIDSQEMYVSETYTIYQEFDEDGLIIGKHLMSKETFGGSSFE